MTLKISEQKMSTEGTTKHASSENAKMPLVASGVARRKRGPAGRETTHPVAVSFQRSTPQGVQKAILNGQSAQIASQKWVVPSSHSILWLILWRLAGNVIDCLVPLQSGMNPPDGSSTSQISAKIARKIVLSNRWWWVCWQVESEGRPGDDRCSV